MEKKFKVSQGFFLLGQKMARSVSKTRDAYSRARQRKPLECARPRQASDSRKPALFFLSRPKSETQPQKK
jgi:hypothetical protein